MSAASAEVQPSLDSCYTEIWRTGPGTLAGRYLRMHWQPVAVADEVRLRFPKPIRIMSEDFTLYRGDSGDLHLLAFRCAHQGTQLSIGWVEGENIRCFNHGWLYGPTGQCLEQPAEQQPFCEKIRIRSYPTEEYLGLVFAYLGEGDPPPLPRYPDVEALGEADRFVSAHPRANNFYYDILPDNVHSTFVHGEGRNTWREKGIRVSTYEETSWGMSPVVDPARPRGGVHTGMPNLAELISPYPDGVYHWLMWRVPVDDGNRIAFKVAHVVGETARANQRGETEGVAALANRVAELTEAVLSGRMRIEEIEATEDPALAYVVQDDVARRGMGAVAERGEHLGSADMTQVLGRQIWARELRALDEGRPLTQWTRPDRGLVPPKQI